MGSLAVTRYDAMCTAIDQAYEVDEVKIIRDKARALEEYARQAKNVEAERRACEIRLRAEHKAGLLRRAEQKLKGRAKKAPPEGGSFPTNAERRRTLGISKKQDQAWQALSKVAPEKLEAAFGNPNKKPSRAALLASNTVRKKTPVSHEALWLWGRLCDFERDGYLARQPSDVLASATPHMLDGVRRLAPLVARWLQKIGA